MPELRSLLGDLDRLSAASAQGDRDAVARQLMQASTVLLEIAASQEFIDTLYAVQPKNVEQEIPDLVRALHGMGLRQEGLTDQLLRLTRSSQPADLDAVRENLRTLAADLIRLSARVITEPEPTWTQDVKAALARIRQVSISTSVLYLLATQILTPHGAALIATVAVGSLVVAAINELLTPSPLGRAAPSPVRAVSPEEVIESQPQPAEVSARRPGLSSGPQVARPAPGDQASVDMRGAGKGVSPPPFPPGPSAPRA